jgi:hypothetical protein
MNGLFMQAATTNFFIGKVKMSPFISMIYPFWNLYPTSLFEHVRFFFAFNIID